MNYTNQYGIPEVFLDAVKADPYDKGDADFSATGLIGPPQIARLWAKHKDDISIDVRDEIWKLLGSGVHAVLERAGKDTQEERLYAGLSGVLLSGAVDVQEGTTITDYKVTSTYSYQMGLKSDWERQVNIYAWLRRKNGRETTEANIVVILRDWMKSRADQDGYPSAPVHTIPVPLWTNEAIEEYLDERITLHTQEETVPCTDEERWARGAWVFKPTKGRSKAYDTIVAASNASMVAGGGTITNKPPQYIRCESWCDVAEFCPQWQKFQSENNSTTNGDSTE